MTASPTMATQRTVQGLFYHCSSIAHLFCINFPDHVSYHNKKTAFARAVSSPIGRNNMGRAEEAVANVRRCSFVQVSTYSSKHHKISDKKQISCGIC